MSSSETSEASLLLDSPSSTPRGQTRGRRGRTAGRRGQGSRGRGESSGRGRQRSRSGSRSGSRSSGRGRRKADEESQKKTDLMKERDEKMKGEIENMPEEELRSLCLQMANAHPGLIFNIMKPAVRQPGGYHPPPGANIPDWCVCNRCREMPTEVERLCCGRADCISSLPNFQLLVLDEEVLAVARIFRRDVLVFEDETNLNKANRHQAYRQFIMWQHGKLGAGVRRVVPSCSVWAIRDKFPDPFGQYTGYIPSRFG